MRLQYNYFVKQTQSACSQKRYRLVEEVFSQKKNCSFLLTKGASPFLTPHSCGGPFRCARLFLLLGTFFSLYKKAYV